MVMAVVVIVPVIIIVVVISSSSKQQQQQQQHCRDRILAAVLSLVLASRTPLRTAMRRCCTLRD
jgi:Na+/serine symporter